MPQDGKTRTAACACGQLSITLVGDPDIASSCNCFACQRRTGSVFGMTAFFARSKIHSTTGDSKVFERIADTGRKVAMHFCPECGSSVYWDLEMKPDVIGVAAGCFADPSFPAPVRNVWGEQKHHWIEFPASMKRYSRNPE